VSCSRHEVSCLIRLHTTLNTRVPTCRTCQRGISSVSHHLFRTLKTLFSITSGKLGRTYFVRWTCGSFVHIFSCFKVHGCFAAHSEDKSLYTLVAECASSHAQYAEVMLDHATVQFVRNLQQPTRTHLPVVTPQITSVAMRPWRLSSSIGQSPEVASKNSSRPFLNRHHHPHNQQTVGFA
jgi:hypothetical protein